jgi:hypothetical protein
MLMQLQLHADMHAVIVHTENCISNTMSGLRPIRPLSEVLISIISWSPLGVKLSRVVPGPADISAPNVHYQSQCQRQHVTTRCANKGR